MNYLILKSIIESTIAHFACKNCGGKISERDVQIVGTGGNGVNMEVHCPHCQTEGMIKAEINMIQNADVASAVPEGMEFVGTVELPTISPEKIKDSDIVALHEKLRSGNLSVHDLLS